MSLHIRTRTISRQFSCISADLKTSDNQYSIISMQPIAILLEDSTLYIVRTRLYNVIARIYNLMTRLYNIIARIYNLMTRLYNVIAGIYNLITRLYNVIAGLYNIRITLYNVVTKI